MEDILRDKFPPAEKKHKDISYFCPFMAAMTSSICPEGLCRFWSQESKDCRWNLFLKLQIMKGGK